MIEKRKTKNILILILFVAMIIAVFSVSKSFAYWLHFSGDSAAADVSVELGEWGVFITVDNNQSDDFETFKISMKRDESLGDEFYDYFSASVAPKTHIGIDQSAYTFDNWYLEDGTVFTKDIVVNHDITVYPSWNTSLYIYGKTGSSYYLYRGSTGDGLNDAENPRDVYFPGWRYKGGTIIDIGRAKNNMNYRNITVNGLWIGDGFEAVYSDAFQNATATSLYLGEGITSIGGNAFKGANIVGSLKIPSTLETISSYAFQNTKFTALDLTDAHSLTTLSTSCFNNVPFTGDLRIGANVTSIGNGAFQGTSFTGTLDLTTATSLTTIGSNVFNGVKFVGSVYFGPTLLSVGASAFANTGITNVDMLDAVNLDSISGSLFVNSKLQSLSFPINGSITSIGASAFQNNKIVGDVILPSGLQTINGVSFSGNTGMTSVFIPASVTSITGNICWGSTIGAGVFYLEASEVDATWSEKWNYYKYTIVTDTRKFSYQGSQIVIGPNGDVLGEVKGTVTAALTVNNIITITVGIGEGNTVTLIYDLTEETLTYNGHTYTR